MSEYYNQIAKIPETKHSSGKMLYGDELSDFFYHLAPGSFILDAGCALGKEAILAEGYDHQVFGIDISPVMVEGFNSKTKKSHAIVCDMESIPLKNNSFDGIVSSCSLLHCNKEKGLKVLGEFKRVLKPNSKVFIVISISENAFEEYYAHKIAQEINLDPIYFYHWNENDFREELNSLGFQIFHWEKITPYSWRPNLLICQANLPQEAFIEKRPLISLGTSWRQYDAVETEKLTQDLVRISGISRLAKIEGLVNIKNAPIYSASRPDSKIYHTNSAGKGVDEITSKLSAIFEALEISCAEKEIPSLYKNLLCLRSNDRVNLIFSKNLNEETEIYWTPVTEYSSGNNFLCPTSHISMLDYKGNFRPNTIGLASDCTLHGALLHGIFEILEHHAFNNAIDTLAAPSLDLTAIKDSYCNDLLQELKSINLTVEIKVLDMFSSFPTYYAVLFNDIENDLSLINGGFGCHVDSYVALRRALTEAVQSRCIAIAGAREDLDLHKRLRGNDFKIIKELNSYWYKKSEKIVSPSKSLLELDNNFTSFEVLNFVLKHLNENQPLLAKLYYFVFPSPKNIYVVKSLLENAKITRG